MPRSPFRIPHSAFRILVVVALCLAARPASSHIGSPDVFFEGNAGPYRLLITVRPPAMIPGVATVEVRDASGLVHRIEIVPLPMTGPASHFPPTPDLAAPARGRPHFFTGQIWFMASGSWKVRVHASGRDGAGEVSVPVPAAPARTLRMQRPLGAALLGVMLVLAAGVVGIVAAAVRDAQLEPGAAASPERKRWGRIAALVSASIVATVVGLGSRWWSVEAAWYERWVYKPLQATASLERGDRLMLRLHDPGWLATRTLSDFVPDHQHLMHLFAVRVPDMNVVLHLHPDLVADGLFETRLPPVPGGRYRLYGDVVHANGFPETVTTEISLPATTGTPLREADDDAVAIVRGISDREGPWSEFALQDGGRVIWARGARPIRANEAQLFQFAVLDATGQPARDLQPYMGMAGHAIFIAADGNAFAHVHPSGSAPMAAVDLANGSASRTVRLPPSRAKRASASLAEASGKGGTPDAPRPEPNAHAVHPAAAGVDRRAVLSFPYGFPRAGRYRIFVQFRRAGRIETASFDALVEA